MLKYGELINQKTQELINSCNNEWDMIPDYLDFDTTLQISSNVLSHEKNILSYLYIQMMPLFEEYVDTSKNRFDMNTEVNKLINLVGLNVANVNSTQLFILRTLLECEYRFKNSNKRVYWLYEKNK